MVYGLRSEPVLASALFDPCPYDAEEERIDALERESMLPDWGDEYGDENQARTWELAETIRECSTSERGRLELKIRAHKRRAPGNLTVQAWLGILAHWDEACAYCRGKEPSGALCIDHVWPVVLGGRTDVRNVAPACKQCNGRKHDDTTEEWLGDEETEFLGKVRAIAATVMGTSR